MLLKTIFFLIILCTSMLNEVCAEGYENPLASPFSFNESRRKNIKSGSLEATAIKDSWKLEKLDTARNFDYLTDIEKDIILALNMVRSDPCRYAELYIKPIINSFEGKTRRVNGRILRTAEGIVPAEELYDYLIHHAQVPVLVVAQDLHRSADELALDQSFTGDTGHISSKGRGFAVRIKSYGRWNKGLSETIGYGGKTGFDIVNNMLIDDGVSDRIHRFVMMDPVFHVVGASVRNHSVYGRTTVIDYAARSASSTTKKEEITWQ